MKHIMIADDEHLLLRSVSVALAKKGYRVTSAVNGLEALEQIRNYEDSDTPVDLLLSDIQMPAITGTELARQLVWDGIRVPILFMTGCTNRSAERLVEKVDEYHLVYKPVENAELLTMIEHILDTGEDVALQDAAAVR